MRLHRFIRDVNLSAGIIRIDDTELFNQLKNVFRLEAGDKIILADGKGSEGTAEIKSFYKNGSSGGGGVEFEVTDISEKISSKTTTLYLAIIKKDNFELATQKAVECGINRIVPIITERTVKLNLNMERLWKISIEAAEQSGRADVPEISEPIKFADAIENAQREKDKNIFLDIKGVSISERLKNIENVSVWVGPEGGWSENELESAKNAKNKSGDNFEIVSLGENTLRAETAAIVASYLISH